jgi:[ribosomal protein S5]-alanine N-acetyltransferase
VVRQEAMVCRDRKLITTERLRGEAVTGAHLKRLHARLYSDEEVMANLGGETLTMERSQASITRDLNHWAQHGFGTWAFFRRTDDALIGRGGMYWYVRPEGRTPGLLYHLCSEHWGQGFATEMARTALAIGFDEIGLERVMSWALPTNLGSQRVLEKCGMRHVYDDTFAELPHRFYAVDRATWCAGVDGSVQPGVDA